MTQEYEAFLRNLALFKGLDPSHIPLLRPTDSYNLSVIAPRYRTDALVVLNWPAGSATSQTIRLNRRYLRVCGVQVKSIALSSGWALGKDTYVCAYSDLATYAGGQAQQFNGVPGNMIGGVTLATSLTREDGQENPVVYFTKPRDLDTFSLTLASFPTNPSALPTVPAGENATIVLRFICLPGET